MAASRISVIAVLLTAVLAPPAPAQPRPQAPPAQPAQPGSVAQPGSAPPTAQPAGAREDYRLGPGDKLRIEVYKDVHLSQSLQVRPDGKITLPLIGDIVAAGLTPIELRTRIETSLKEFVANPVVTVIVVEVVEPVVYVMGEVNQPGSVTLRGPMTVLQALAEAGGFKEFADPNGIRILRRNGDANRLETIRFRYKNALKPNAPVVYLREGDTVVVP